MNPGDRDLVEGDVVHFHCLHPDHARRVNKVPDEHGLYLYEVPGKPRPMLVLGEVGVDGRGVRWYRVLKLSTKVSDWKRKLGYVRLGAIVEEDRVSYADRTPYCYPSNLVDGSIINRVDRLTLKAIHDVIRPVFNPSHLTSD
jgi:hypothetical protein